MPVPDPGRPRRHHSIDRGRSGLCRADRIAQESVLVETMKPLLEAGGKTMNRAAYSALQEMTGFDLRTFAGNLEKLISFVGDRPEITVADVESVLQRTKIDPIYELTNAVADRKLDEALLLLKSVQASGVHPLQAFAAIVNQIRKLLLVRDFIESPYGRQWQTACPYDYFQKQVLPAVGEYDRQLLDELDNWQALLEQDSAPSAAGTAVRTSKKKKKAKPGTDLLVAKNPANPYPIYLLLKKSANYSKDELINAFETLHSADKQLKSSGQNPELVLEKVIFDICKFPAAESRARHTG